MGNLVITILAGGQGKRMNSPLPKVLHSVDNVPMIIRILREAKKLNPHKIIIVVGQFKNVIQETIEQHAEFNNINIEYAIQETPLGTGNAVLSTLSLLSDDDTNLIVNGDNPLLKSDTLQNVLEYFSKGQQSDLLITAVNASDPSGSGRIILKDNRFDGIIEEKDCNEEQRKLTIVNCGIYVAYGNVLKKYIPLIKNNNAQKEYYLTDIVEVYRSDGNFPSLYILPTSKELEMVNVNTKDQLDNLNNILSTTK